MTWRDIQDGQILDVGTSEDNVVIDVIAWRDFRSRVFCSAFSTKRSNLLQGNGGFFTIDVVQDTNIARELLVSDVVKNKKQKTKLKSN